MATVKRDVCTSCGANWHVAPGAKCPSCKGTTVSRDCTVDEAGVVKVAE